MHVSKAFGASFALVMMFVAAIFTSSVSAAQRQPEIAGYCWATELTSQGTTLYHSAVFQKASTYFDRDDWRVDFRAHLHDRGVDVQNAGCRVWPGNEDAILSVKEAQSKDASSATQIVTVDWVPDDTFGGSKIREAESPPRTKSDSRPSAKSAYSQTTPSTSVPAPPKYVEVAGPDGKTIRLSPEVAARNKAAAEEYRHKMEAHAQAKADHDQKLVDHQRNAANATAAKQAHERVLAAKAAEVAAHKAAMDDYNKKLAGASTEDDPNRCITSPAIKPGLRGNTEVHVTNGCDQKVDIVICLKRTSGDWLCGAQFGILAQRSMSFMSTNATGEIYVDAVTFGSKNKLGRPAGIIK